MTIRVFSNCDYQVIESEWQDWKYWAAINSIWCCRHPNFSKQEVPGHG